MYYFIDSKIMFKPYDLELCNAETGQAITIPLLSAEILNQLLSKRCSPVTRDMIFNDVFKKNNANATDNNLNQHVFALRKHIATLGGAKDLIVTIPKIGFSISSEHSIVEQRDDEGMCISNSTNSFLPLNSEGNSANLNFDDSNIEYVEFNQKASSPHDLSNKEKFASTKDTEKSDFKRNILTNHIPYDFDYAQNCNVIDYASQSYRITLGICIIILSASFAIILSLGVRNKNNLIPRIESTKLENNKLSQCDIYIVNNGNTSYNPDDIEKLIRSVNSLYTFKCSDKDPHRYYISISRDNEYKYRTFISSCSINNICNSVYNTYEKE